MNLDYVDPDVAYLWGLILARGEFHVAGDTRRLIVQFPYRQTTIPGLNEIGTDRETAIRLGLDEIRNRVQELLETTVAIDRGQHMVTLRAVFTRNTIGWRDLRYLTQERGHYTEFEIPDFAFDFEREILVELIRGFADASSDPNPADADRNGIHRVVLQVQFGNWRIPIQLCRLLQVNLQVPVSHILWGHPNMRAPGGGKGWAKETRIRIYAQDFEPIGYYFRFKRQAFEQLVCLNRNEGARAGKFCNPKAKRVSSRSKKEAHPGEQDERLPVQIRGSHFDAYYQICRKLGCSQGKKPPQLEIFDDEDSE